MQLTIHHARRIRDELGIDLIACLTDPTRIDPTFAALETRRVCRSVARVCGWRGWRNVRSVVAAAVIAFFPVPQSTNDNEPNGGPLYQDDLPVANPWEWIDRMLGMTAADDRRVTLRQLIHRVEGRKFHDHVVCGSITAAIFNSRRRKRSDRWFTFRDFHPHYLTNPRVPTGREQVDFLTSIFMAP